METNGTMTREEVETAVSHNGQIQQRRADLTNLGDVQSLVEQATAEVNRWNGRLEVLIALRDHLTGIDQKSGG